MPRLDIFKQVGDGVRKAAGTLEISTGGDLQKDAEVMPKAAVIFGALLEIKEQLNEYTDQQKILWEKRGKALLN